MDKEKEHKEKQIYYFKDDITEPDPIHDYGVEISSGKTPLIIDNGSYKCRVGWATDDQPRIIFKNVIAKQRGKKETETLIGNDITNLEVVRWQLKSQFDRNVVTQYDTQEQILDYTFSHLGVDTPGGIDHPIVMTEAICNPNYSRQLMSELLFECYHIPKVAYGVDALFSLYNNHPTPETANSLVVSCGYQSTHILPVLGGRLQGSNCRRINMGGAHLDSFMQRLLQLKYPAHLNNITVSRAEELVRDHCQMGVDYAKELADWSNEEFYMDNVHIMELPHIVAPVPVVNEEQQQQKREQQVQRLREINQRRREEKLAEDQERLQKLLAILEIRNEDQAAFKRGLSGLDVEDEKELLAEINKLNNAINRLNNKLIADETELQVVEPEAPKSKKPKEDVKTPSLLKEYEEINDPKELDKFISKIKQDKQDIIDARLRRKQHKSDMAKRRTLASQQRMKMITELAQGSRKKKEDTFGANDDDWNVYKQINKDAGDSDSEAEMEKLEEFDAILKEIDPEFKDPNEDQVASPVDPKEFYRLYVGVERIRIPELLFQPSMIGVEQAGISETMDFVLKKFSLEEQNVLVQNIFLTGACCNFQRFKERLERELLSLRPFQSTFNIKLASDPTLDCWYGAQKWAKSPLLDLYSITKQDYEEKGGEYLKDHCASNNYSPTPLVKK